ncbi:dihydrofolate reductase [Nonomuraea sp. NN258]|uniref:dihydrofolate reductase family protein n=1 Tax=Nonomuraea antri TaxID=2730852 RepID=UPI001569E2EA|nr:dihydrofolate reductase family protein [Nonomuraea antri]NRQ40764.1 dihydrofolate reductase [Nonomuraea antri]
MRKIAAGLFISLDGVIEAPETWHFPYFNDEMGQSVGRQFEAADAMLLGRRTYEGFAEYWPKQDPAAEPMAEVMNNTPKYVVSTTLTSADWQNTTLIQGDVAAELGRIKQQPGKNISITGSATLVQSLLRDGLLDELNLLVHPIVVGSGQRLFDGDLGQIPLKLTRSEIFSTGVLDLTYERA